MRVDLLARGRADVALLRPRVLLVDALLDLGQQLDQLAAPFFLRRARSGVPWSRCGSGGGSAASSRRPAPAAAAALLQLPRSACCASSSASPSSVSAEGGSGRGGAAASRASPPPARWPGRSPGPCSGASLERDVDQDHLERRVLEDAVEALRVDEAHQQQGAMRGDRHGERDLQRREAQPRIVASGRGADSAIGGEPAPGSASATSTAIVSGPAAGSSSSASSAGVVGGGCGVVEALDDACRARRASAGRCRRAAPAPARRAARARRRRRGTPAAGSSARTRPSFITVAVEFARCRPAAGSCSVQKRSMPRLEAVVGGVGGVEARDDREQVGVLGLERRRQRRGLAVARRTR